MQELDFYISKNGRYIMLENIIYDASKNRYAHINEISFSDLIDIIGENVNFTIQNLNSNISEISSFTRKNVYHVLEYFKTDEKLTLMMEEKTQLLEQTLNPFNKDFYTTSNWKKTGQNIITGATSTIKSIGNAILHPVKTAEEGIEWI